MPASVFFGRFKHLATRELGNEDETNQARYSVSTLCKLVPPVMRPALGSLRPNSWNELRTEFYNLARALLFVHVDHEEIFPPPPYDSANLKDVHRILLLDIESAAGPVYESSFRVALARIHRTFPNLSLTSSALYTLDAPIRDTFALADTGAAAPVADLSFLVPEPVTSNVHHRHLF
ncbi:hypothetical protein B0I72DRAFT_162369 [Yarrowia lipolytica]|uniref:Uncharacterized protein n=1 Tax=Yarrowia lipolytica TaxID=4952 RepID=A0A371C2M2_YARLL|nr:hypothetical protein B0I71DRAFT_167987 [Yarrowia lipolytica]RDW34767.1 hypothetical protein B0I72DRAFT_162369 [Yarrowia lipolytica]RDW36267.1 hypothetical protein B0I73DRAFT_164150 [Yarrowia lipolytica]RDW43262.1 hypothetical protein B0I74DRAFT_162242 [Yarrowia lipolytica]RDW50056.1 hypothetical protein B0I75DRAFT_167709 [Yarrowia lipolytica]